MLIAVTNTINTVVPILGALFKKNTVITTEGIISGYKYDII